MNLSFFYNGDITCSTGDKVESDLMTLMPTMTSTSNSLRPDYMFLLI